MIMDMAFKDICSFDPSLKRRIKFIISDVDDTITTDGRLLPKALDALYRLKAAGKYIILVTGGSAGWSDGYIRQWPVDCVISESGALLLYRSEDNSICYETNPLIMDRVETASIRSSILKMTEEKYVFSSDQYARIYDIAYERNCLDDASLSSLLEIIRINGCKALISSIHVNVLLADYSKAGGVKAFFSRIKTVLGFSENWSDFISSSLALGDSRNDEALFKMFPHSIGNKRVFDERSSFSVLPEYYTMEYGGDSFASVAGLLCSEN